MQERTVQSEVTGRDEVSDVIEDRDHLWIDPTHEEAYWRENHARQPYANNRSYDDFAPAYRVGYEGYAEYGANGRSFAESEDILRREYERQNAKLRWPEARVASQAAWNRFGTTRRA